MPSPAGATSVDKWQKVGESVIRFFTGTRRGDAVRVNLAGMQTVDGTVERRCIFAYVPDNIAEPDAASAREAAADLLAAADELEGNRPSHVYEVD